LVVRRVRSTSRGSRDASRRSAPVLSGHVLVDHMWRERSSAREAPGGSLAASWHLRCSHFATVNQLIHHVVVYGDAVNQPIHHVIAAKGSQVEAIDPDDLVEHAIARMNGQHIGSLVVLRDDQLVGILTERDLLVRVLAARRDPATTKVRDVMTRDVVVLRLCDTIASAMAIVTHRRCRHLPVVEEDGRICGVVSSGDLTAWLVRDQEQTIDDLHQYITR
jgi:CBS domain-containing protein